MMNRPDRSSEESLLRERGEILRQLEDWLEMPMLVLGLAWLALLIVELTRGLSPMLEIVGAVIWIIFILDFGLKFALAPDRLAYLKGNWLTAISLLVPALRVFRVARAVRMLRIVRIARGLRLVQVIGSLNREMRALGATMSRRGLGYVIALTLLVALAGAAGMYAFEKESPDGNGLNSYGTALWWTAMMMTTMGTDYWPKTPEGRVLCLILALYAFAVFGYLTATLATFFIGRDAENEEAELASAKSVAELRNQIIALRDELQGAASDKEAPSDRKQG